MGTLRFAHATSGNVSGLGDLVLGRRWTFVGGKGGVGKTTTAAALAITLADAGEPVLVLSLDPAHSLGDALGLSLGPNPSDVPGVPGLSAAELDATLENESFIAHHRDQIVALVDRGTYLETDDVNGFVELGMPGIDELAALLGMMAATRNTDGDTRRIIDTAPTGHTLRLLGMPKFARSWIEALQAMDDKHQAVASALSSSGVVVDDATRFMQRLSDDLDALDRELRDPQLTRFVLVTTPEPTVRSETSRYIDALGELGVAIGGMVVNRGTRVPEADGAIPAVLAPTLATEPVGVDGLRRFADVVAGSRRPGSTSSETTTAERVDDLDASIADVATDEQAARASADSVNPWLAGDSAATVPARAETQRIRIGEGWSPPTDRSIYLVAGKGGVGKSTIAGALAVFLADAGRQVLLLSTDPAGSLREIFAVEQVEDAGSDVPGLTVQQIDAERDWDEFTESYRSQATEVFENLVSGGVSAEMDRAVAERLIDLAPPGLDELVAIMEVVDAIEDEPYNAVVLDTAPTGHLLRMLETPEIALDWVQAAMRLLLKYREVVRAGELGERLIRLSRSLKALIARLSDAEDTWPLVVALPEELSIAETQRLMSRLDELGIPPGVLLVNRLLTPDAEIIQSRSAKAAELMRRAAPLEIVAAEDHADGPTGLDELRRFSRSWRRVVLEPR